MGSLVGYSRAVMVGNHICVSGTTATDCNGELVGKGDAYAHTHTSCFKHTISFKSSR